MCIIINKIEGKKLKKETYENCILEHPDGCGVAYVENDKLIVKKGLWKLDEFMSIIEPIEEKHVLIHFRTASPQMEVSLENCHPFALNCTTFTLGETEDPRFFYAVAHNGRLEWRSTKEISDTRFFIHDLLNPTMDRDPWFLDHFPGQFMMEATINRSASSNNKIVVMRWDAEEKKIDVRIVNEKAGNIDDGVWFSNMSWRLKPLPKMAQFLGMGGHAGVYGDGEWYGHSGRQTKVYPSTTKNEKGETDYTKIFKHLPDWHMPDDKGWYWDFKEDEFVHCITKVRVKTLSFRAAPYDTAKFKNHGTFIPKYPVGALEAQAGGRTIIPISPVVGDQLPIVIVPDKVDKEDPLAHLTKDEKGMLIHEAVIFLKESGFTKKMIRDMDGVEKVEALRDGFLWCWDIYKDMDDKEVDHLMIAQIKEGTFDREHLYLDAAGYQPKDIKTS